MKPRFLMGLDAGGGGGRALLVNITTGEIFSVTHPWANLVMMKRKQANPYAKLVRW